MPLRWEIPGGGCDDTDASILHSAARELHEEAGLVARSIGPEIGGGYFFRVRAGKGVVKFNFLVEVQTDGGQEKSKAGGEEEEVKVKLDSSEHEAFVWATENEVRADRVGEMGVRFTTKEQKSVILQAFKVRVDLKDGEV